MVSKVIFCVCVSSQVTGSQLEFFRMLDEKIEKVRAYNVQTVRKVLYYVVTNPLVQ